MKVLHVIPSVSGKHGGPSYAIKSLANASKTAGIKTVVATTDDDGDDSCLTVPLGQAVARDGITHFFFHRDLLPYKISFGLARWLNRHVAEFDVVHIHALFSFSSLVAAHVAHQRNVPYIIRPLGVLNRWGLENRRPRLKRVWLRFIELRILRRAAATHYTTEAERAEAAGIHPDIGKMPFFVIPIPVEPSPASASAQDFTNRFAKASGKKVVLFMSRLDAKKGIELLLRAFVSIRQKEPEALLVIAGDGEDQYVKSLQQIAGELGITNDVLWTGFLEASNKAAAFAAATVFVLPSYSENFGIAAAEALAAGVACVLSDQVALTENVQQNNSAMIVPCDSAAIAKAVNELLSQPEIRTRMAKSGREVADQHFSSEAVGEMLLHRYQSIVAARN